MEVNTMFDELRGDERSKDLLQTVTKDGLLSFEYWYAIMSRNSEGDGVREEFQDKVTLRLMTQESGLSRVIFGARDATFSVLKKSQK